VESPSRIYRKVFVDLVAPAELALPKMYEDRMVARGYVVRRWFGNVLRSDISDIP
jgi:hypothetical protein